MVRTEEQHTAATRHPEWQNIVSDIETRFQHYETVRLWSIRAVGAYLLGMHSNASHIMLCLGESLSSALVEICTKRGVDLKSLDVHHVHS